MTKFSHQAFGIFLALVAFAAVIALAINGVGYYLTPLELRPFRPDYATMKPSGTFSHGLGIVGSLMIALGVSTSLPPQCEIALVVVGSGLTWGGLLLDVGRTS